MRKSRQGTKINKKGILKWVKKKDYPKSTFLNHAEYNFPEGI